MVDGMAAGRRTQQQEQQQQQHIVPQYAALSEPLPSSLQRELLPGPSGVQILAAAGADLQAGRCDEGRDLAALSSSPVTYDFAGRGKLVHRADKLDEACGGSLQEQARA